MSTRIAFTESSSLVPTTLFAISGSLAVGDAVCQVAGADKTVAKADADNASARPPIGVVHEIRGTDAVVALNGEVAAGLTGLTRGTAYWLSTTAGALVATKPATNAYLVGVAVSASELLVNTVAADLIIGGGGGSVTSFGVTSSDITVSNSPITSSGVIDLALNTVPVSKGGTGLTSATEQGASLIASSSSAYVAQATSLSWRNRIINGDMRISQRNEDKPVTPSASSFPVDRWNANSTVSTGTFYASRMAGWSVYFDGSGDYLTIADATAIRLGGSAFSIEAWIYPTTSNQNAEIVSKRAFGAFGSYALFINSSNQLCFVADNNTTSPWAISLAGGTITANSWSHLAVTRVGTTWTIYINGSSVASTSSSIGITDTATSLSIGAYPTGQNAFTGYISNVRIIKDDSAYYSAFTPQTIPLTVYGGTGVLVCASSNITDKSVNSFSVTVNGNAVASPLSPFTRQAPSGFDSSLRWSVTAVSSGAAAAQLATIEHRVEGNNVYDFQWGSAAARSITLSFWVMSSVAGTYCVSIQNSSKTLSYVAQYAVSSANTWEKKTINIAGPASSIWDTDNAIGIRINFDLGSGSSYNTTAGAWQNGNFCRTTSQVNFIGSAFPATGNFNDFCVSGVQLELGSVATPFEMLQYEKQLELCQRYYARLSSLSGNNVGFGAGVTFQGGASAGGAFVYIKYPQQMRASPTLNYSNTAVYNTSARTVTSFQSPHYGTDSMSLSLYTGTNTQTVGQGVVFTGNIAPTWFDLSAEL